MATGIILLVGLLIALYSPEIASWRSKTIDSLIHQAKSQTTDEAKYSYLTQAQLVNNTDPIATQAIAKFWIDRGEVERAIGVYTDAIVNPNYSYLGNLALQAQSYNQALVFFQKANKEDKTSASLSGESAALYNLGKISEGCDKATQASKLDLSSEVAKNALTNCITLGGTSADTVSSSSTNTIADRAAAYTLINSSVFKPGEEKLLAVTTKSVADYLVLARLSAARGDIAQAAQRAEQGIALDKSNIDLNKALVTYYGIMGESQKQSLYQNRLNELIIIRNVK